ncbi:MAG: histidine phosphatase family protein [Acidimicrobiia bacterium]|nr:histidine phosphatase family protein [Acidimicrobiia bacterium]
MKQLLVMRHGKSDWSAGKPDHDRPLNPRGVDSARAMGIALAKMGEEPDLVISSTATRAATTAQLAAEAGDWESELTYSGSLYGTSAQGTLEVLLETAQTAHSVMVVGHQPTWGNLVAHLTGGAVAMKTATVAKIDLYIRDWTDALHAQGELVFLLQPRSMQGILDTGA